MAAKCSSISTCSPPTKQPLRRRLRLVAVQTQQHSFTVQLHAYFGYVESTLSNSLFWFPLKVQQQILHTDRTTKIAILSKKVDFWKSAKCNAKTQKYCESLNCWWLHLIGVIKHFGGLSEYRTCIWLVQIEQAWHDSIRFPRGPPRRRCFAGYC